MHLQQHFSSSNSTAPTTSDSVEPSQSSSDPDQTKVIVASTVTSAVLLAIVVAVITIITVTAVKRFGTPKVVLQVTGESVDILGETKLPSIIIHRYCMMIVVISVYVL